MFNIFHPRHLPLLLLTLTCVSPCRAAETTTTLSLDRVDVGKGSISSMDTSALSTLDLSGIQAGSLNVEYLELDPAGNRYFWVHFFYTMPAVIPANTEMITMSLQANSQGTTWNRQKTKFQIRNHKRKKWQLLGNTQDAEEGVWLNQVMMMDGRTLDDFEEKYVRSGQIETRVRSKRNQDILRLDLLQVNVTMTTPSTPAPVAVATPAPANVVTPAPVDVVTPAPVTSAPVVVPTPAPVTPAPVTIVTPAPVSSPTVPVGTEYAVKLMNDLPVVDPSVTLGNPFTGLLTSPLWTSYDNQNDGIPSSMDFYYIGLDTTMTGMNSYDWSTFEGYLNDSAGQNRHAIVRFIMDYPSDASYVPQFLLDAGLEMTAYDDGLGPGVSPNYSSPLLLTALENFITKFGELYDGDDRIAFIQLGLLGHWGEWHTYPNSEWIPSTTFEAVSGWYDDAFSMTPLQARYPDRAGVTERGFGMHDDSFTHSTLTTNPDLGWFFWPTMESTGYTDSWKTSVTGGEVRPENQNIVFSSGFGTGDYEQDFDLCVDTTHATYMLLSSAFSDGYQGADLERARESTARMGYQFAVVRVAAFVGTDSSLVDIEVNVEQSGVAPFYYPLSLQFECSPGNSWKIDGVEDLIEAGSSQAFRFNGVPATDDCLGSIVLSLDSDFAYDGNPVKFAQGAEGKVGLSFSSPP